MLFTCHLTHLESIGYTVNSIFERLKKLFTF